MPRKLLTNFFVAIVFMAIASVSQAQLYEVKIEEKIANSNLIIEGKVVSQQSFWNEGHTMIFTANKIELYKIFKGSSNLQYIEVVTQGGTVGNQSIHASDMLELTKEQVGLFFCFPNVSNLRSPLTNNIIWDVYSSSQGYFDYNLDNETAAAPFVRYGKISTDLYNELATKIGHGFENKKPSFDVTKQKKNTNTNRVLAPAITGFSPTTINAGALSDPANNVLTITGTGFGASFTGSAAVQFAEANNGGASYYSVLASDAAHVASLMVSWSDTEIKIRVPTRAGTGSFIVKDATGVASSISANPLNVRFAILTSTLPSGGTNIKQLNLMNENNLGGYSILYSTNTANSGVDITASPALLAFQRSLNTWKEIAGFNVTEAGTTSMQTIADDNINVIMFDNAAANSGTPLPSGTLATCYSFSGICSPIASFEARKKGFDIVIRSAFSGPGATFNFSSCPPNSFSSTQTDFESVAFHELGHAMNLAHIIDGAQGSSAGYINPSKLMHYATSSTTKRTSPDYSAKAGSVYTCTAHGGTYGSCYVLNSEMTQLTTISESKDDCPGSFPVAPTQKNTSVAFDMVHTSSNSLVDPVYTKVRCDGLGAAVTNNAYYAIKTSTAGSLSLAINNYVTVPSELASCSQLPPVVPVTGFRAALYPLSSCPSPNSFPAQIACWIFAGNGMSSFSNIPAGTYLLLIESIENTKATFNLVFDGTALPIKLSSFTGEIVGSYNNLNWITESVIDVSKIIVERSTNGTNFENIGEITGSAAYNKKGNFKDFKPAIGNSYYRLQIVNSNGSMEYSNVVLLKRNDKFLFNISPNPAVGFAEVQVSSEVKGSYTIMLHNATGQKVMSKTIYVNSNMVNTRLDVSNLTKGIYSVTVFDATQSKVKTMLLSVQ